MSGSNRLVEAAGEESGDQLTSVARGRSPALFERLGFFEPKSDVGQFQQAGTCRCCPAVIPGTIAIVTFQIRFGRNPQILGIKVDCRFGVVVVLLLRGQKIHSRRVAKRYLLMRIAS